jgi:hypothetical protein
MATEVLSQNAMNLSERLAKCMTADLGERALDRWLDVNSRAQSVRGAGTHFLQSVLHSAHTTPTDCL